MLPRNVRNNNPGNIDAGPAWAGLMSEDQMNDEQKAETRFAVFVSPAYGFRALIRELNVYYFVHSKKTVRQIIDRWAPSNENDTVAYVQDVAIEIGVGEDTELPWPATAAALAKAITRHETGSWEPYWHDQDLSDGARLAGL